MNKKLLLLGSILAFSVSNAVAQGWAIPAGPIQTQTLGPVSIGNTHVSPWFNGSSLSVLNGEDVSSSTTSPATLRLVKHFVGFAYSSGYTPGNIIEALTDNQMDPPGPPPPPAPNPTTGFVLTSGFNMGIGTPMPISRLDVHNGEIALTNNSSSADRFIRAHTNDGSFRIMTGTSVDNPYLEMTGKNHSSPGQMNFINSDVAGGKFEFLKSNGTNWTSQMTIRNDGKVVIGNVPVTAPGLVYDYKLYVQDGILTPRVKVALPSSNEWSDFVFAEDYRLKPLNEVEDFISENKHLPDFPSADEVVKSGIDVAAMDAKLLQKIEELTLYVIEQNKKITTLEKKLNQQQKK